jgi:hypothetical protein
MLTGEFSPRLPASIGFVQAQGADIPFQRTINLTSSNTSNLVISATVDIPNGNIVVSFDTRITGGSGTPGGSNTQVQYNNNGSFGGSANLTFDAINTLTLTGGIVAGPGNTAATSFIRPANNQTVYSLLGRSQAGPGIQGRWDSATGNRYLSFGVYDNAGAYTEIFQANSQSLIISPGSTAATSFLKPNADVTLYSLLGREQAGPGIQGRWDSGTANRYLAFGTYDNAGTWSEAYRVQGGTITNSSGNLVINGTSGVQLQAAGAEAITFDAAPTTGGSSGSISISNYPGSTLATQKWMQVKYAGARYYIPMFQ